ncbi:Transposase [Peptoniphilus asaccharolyticus DSM 20463]|uniref:Transposase n=2 Tax=Peptoniphilus asaccharolyticus TaxID=1258 RepID=A0A1W1VHE3_PEPAS|nr:ISL3 family transposase [Peptoniphilus asaccharolyticus]SMB92772.1 Transposase [Peptoniphilus asaccharolyticus DSM 20463]
MQNNNIMNLFGFKDVVFDSVDESNNFVNVHASVSKMSICPHCGSKKIWVHDHRIQKIRDTHIRGKKSLIFLKKTRYDCKSCGSRFERNLDFIAKGHTMTNRLVFAIVSEFDEIYSISSIANRYNVSSNTVLRILNCLSASRAKLPEVLCIDEFKGDSGNIKYQTSLLNGDTHKIIDILPSRDKSSLAEYFKRIPSIEKRNVKFFVSDMSKAFKSVKKSFFKNAIHIIDRYHFIRQVSWALENVRKRIQKDISSKLRKYFKRSKSLITKPASKLTSEQANEVSLMIELNKELKEAYKLKELFYCVPCGYQYVLSQPNKTRAKKALREWIKRADESKLKEFKSCITSFNNWFEEICNSFDYSWSNGPLEGTHTKIKTLKRNCFGMRNFDLFRKRIMFSCK